MSLAARQTEQLSGFDPRVVPNLEGWYDAANPSGFGVALPTDGTALTQWNDLSGKGRHLTQATATKRPVWRRAKANMLTAFQSSFEGSLDMTSANGVTVGNGNTTVSVSTTWAKYGSQSLLVTYNGTGSDNDIYATPGGEYSIAFPVVPGKTYTIMGTCHLEAAQAGNAGVIRAQSRMIIAYLKMSTDGSSYRTFASAQAANVAGTTDLSVTFTVPTGAGTVVEFFFRLYNGSQNASDAVYWDGVSLSEGTVAPTYWTPPNNPPSVRFDGVDDYMAVTGTLTNPTTVYATWRSAAKTANSYQTVFDGAGVPASNHTTLFLRMASWTGTASLSQIEVNGGGSSQGTGISLNPTIWHASLVSFTGGINAQLGNDNGPIHTGNTGTLSMGGITAGTSIQSLPQVMNGDIGTLLIYSGLHDTPTRQRILSWLGGRNQISLARP